MNIDFDLPQVDIRQARYPVEQFAQLHPQPPVWSEPLNAWIVTRHDDIRKIYADYKSFSNEDGVQKEAAGPTAMLFFDSAMHNRQRAVWANELSAKAMDNRVALFSRLASTILGPVVERLNAGEDVEMVDVFKDFAIDAITALMDLPNDRRVDFKRWILIIGDSVLLPLAPDDPRYKARADNKKEVYDFIHTAIRDRQARLAAGEEPQDLTTMFVRAIGDHGITEEMAADNLLNLFLGAYDTTVRWLGNIFAVLARYPEIWAELRADPSVRAAAYEEIMRYESVVQLNARKVRNEGATIAGQPVAKGADIMMLNGVANRDEAVFADPDRFDIHREQKMHLGFGFGMHQCLGMHTARAEVAAFLNYMLEAVPAFEVTGGEYYRNWAVWGPAKLHISMTA